MYLLIIITHFYEQLFLLVQTRFWYCLTILLIHFGNGFFFNQTYVFNKENKEDWSFILRFFILNLTITINQNNIFDNRLIGNNSFNGSYTFLLFFCINSIGIVIDEQLYVQIMYCNFLFAFFMRSIQTIPWKMNYQLYCYLNNKKCNGEKVLTTSTAVYKSNTF